MMAPRGKPPSAPALTAVTRREAVARRVRLRDRESGERVRMFRGLVVLAMLVLLLSMLHGGWGRAFVPGWWRQW